MPHGDRRQSLGAWHVFALLGFFVCLVLLRCPEIVAQGGRFWAEEGVFYFHDAWTLPWRQAWFAVLPDYFNFIASFATWAAMELGGIGYAPLVTLIISLLVQMLAPVIILTHALPWRRSNLSSLVAVALCALPPVTGEVWLNTITSQFHLALAAGLILAAPAERGGLLAFDAFVLSLGVLSGPATSFLTPLFGLRAVVTRRRADLLLAGIILIGFCLQLWMYLTHPVPARGSHISVAQLLSAIALHVFVLGFAGFHAGEMFGASALAMWSRQALLWPGALVVALAYGGLIWCVWGSGRYRPTLALLLMVQALFSILSFDNAMDGDFGALMNAVFGQRYAFAPMVLTGLILTGCACATSGSRKYFSGILSALLLVIGIWNFRAGLEQFSQGPAWAAQIAAWRQNPQTPLDVWPGGSWKLTLPPRN